MWRVRRVPYELCHVGICCKAKATGAGSMWGESWDELSTQVSEQCMMGKGSRLYCVHVTSLVLLSHLFSEEEMKLSRRQLYRVF